jgi:hypothetical protein
VHREAIFQQFLRFEHLFNNLGTAKGIQFEVNLSDPRPVKQPVRRVTAAQREIITEQVNEMLRLGVIRKSNSPWSTPCVLVKKKNGETRLCLDYRSLNQMIFSRIYKVLSIFQRWILRVAIGKF